MTSHSKARLIRIVAAVAVGIVTFPGVASSQLQFDVIHSFPDPGPVRPQSQLLLAADGSFYGTTIAGGAADQGTIFKMTPAGAFTLLHSFTGFTGGLGDGAAPSGAMVQALDGNFYGTTGTGGALDRGTVFRMTPAGTVTILHSFTGSGGEGFFPYGGLALATDGTLYGTTLHAAVGSGGLGTAFKITTGGTFTTLHTFTGNPDGATPYATLLQANDGNFYGVTCFGGSVNKGTLFRMTPAGAVTILHNFVGEISGQVGDGALPQGTLIQATDGNLWGATNTGGQNVGVVFKSDLSGNLTIVHEFLGTTDGDSSVAPLLQGPDGNFYGTTLYGGSPQCGSVFKVTPAGALTLLRGFTCASDGSLPFFGVTLAPDGSFYGAAYQGGASNAGVIYQVTSAGAFTVRHVFSGSTDGARPQTTLVRGTDGNLYGTTLVGGASNQGTVLKITPAGAVTLLHSFNDLGDGYSPTGLVQANDGNFYGAAAKSTTIFNPDVRSVMFRITSGGTFTFLRFLTYSSDGFDPNPMIQGTDGDLYGTVKTGGPFNGGAAFKMTLSGSFTTLHAFGGPGDGATPEAALVQATDGNFYGTTRFGGASNRGTLFRMTPAGTVTILHSFTGFTGGNDGHAPVAPLIQAADGNLYGTTIVGGTSDVGTVFRTNLAGTYTVLHSFDGTVGYLVYSPVTQGADGLFYGTTTASGGAANAGAVYTMTAAGAVSLVHAFNNTDGRAPYAGLVRTTGSNLYGMTLQGGPSGINGMGVVFRLHSAVVPFTDDPLTAGIVTKAVHVTQLRSRIDQLRSGFGLSPFGWTEPTLTVGTTTVKAVHITDLRLALTQTYAAAGLPPPSYTDAITPGVTVVRAVHISELRTLVQALE